MLNSMTGFGRACVQDDFYSINTEIKGVNHRFLEISIRLPRQFNQSEDGLKKLIQSRLSRGKIDVFISFEQVAGKNMAVKVDKPLLIGYYNALSEVAETCNIEMIPSLHSLASFSGVITVEGQKDDEEQVNLLLQQSLSEALDNMVEMRKIEGAALAQDLQNRLGFICETTAKIADLAPIIIEEQRQRLGQRIKTILQDVEIDQNRLANELAYFVDKVDVSEELTRLNSHVDQFSQSLNNSAPIGRKLEFMLQEMLREINTIGSKSNALTVSKLVVDVKSELEKIREQIQNIE